MRKLSGVATTISFARTAPARFQDPGRGGVAVDDGDAVRAQILDAAAVLLDRHDRQTLLQEALADDAAGAAIAHDHRMAAGAGDGVRRGSGHR